METRVGTVPEIAKDSSGKRLGMSHINTKPIGNRTKSNAATWYHLECHFMVDRIIVQTKSVRTPPLDPDAIRRPRVTRNRRIFQPRDCARCTESRPMMITVIDN